MRFTFIAAKKAEHTVTILCRCLRVTRSGFYAWGRRKVSAHAQEDARLRVKIRAFFKASAGRYGSPRILGRPARGGDPREPEAGDSADAGGRAEGPRAESGSSARR